METPNEGTVGWRFSPKDEELINYFLKRKINGLDDDVKIIREIDVCKWEPWDLPGQSVLKSDDNEWFFFCQRDQKFASSSRLNRATRKGYWKATGKDRKIKSKKGEIGKKRTLVFHTGRAPTGKRTCWVIHEYMTTLKELDGTHAGQRPYVICRLFKKDDESLLDANDNDVEITSLSPNPTEPSSMELKPDSLSYQVGSSSKQECEKALVNFENCKDGNTKATNQEPQPDMNLDYIKLFGDPDPNDLSLIESPTMESMGSSLPPHSATDNFCINENSQLVCVNNEQDDCTSDDIQSFLTNSLNYCGQDNDWISNFDFDIPEYELMNQYDVSGAGSSQFLDSNSENADLSALMAELEQFASNEESSGPISVTDDTRTSFKELGNFQARLVHQGGTSSNGFGQEQCASPEDIVSSTQNNLNSHAYATHTGIQIRHRQPQTTPANTNFNKHGTANRRIRLQTNLGRCRISIKSESEAEVSSEPLKSNHTKQTVTKKFISSIFSPFKPSSSTASYKLIFGLALVFTIFIIYAGIHVCIA